MDIDNNSSEQNGNGSGSEEKMDEEVNKVDEDKVDRQDDKVGKEEEKSMERVEEDEKQEEKEKSTSTNKTTMDEEKERKSKEEKEKSLYSTIFGSGDEDDADLPANGGSSKETKTKESDSKSSSSKKRKRDSSSSKKKSSSSSKRHKKSSSSSSKKSSKRRSSKKRKKSDSDSENSNNESDMEESSTRNSLEQVRALKRNMNSSSTSSSSTGAGSTTTHTSSSNLNNSSDSQPMDQNSIDQDNDTNYESSSSSLSMSSPSSIREKKPPKDSTPTNRDDIVLLWIDRMDKAYEADSVSLSNNQPATNKLSLLPTLLSTLSKNYLQEAFIDNGVFKHFAKWLKPLPDGSLPNSKIRTELLDIMLKFPLPTTIELKSSRIGKVVRFLTMNEKDPKTKKVAVELLQRWATSVFEIRTDYRELEECDQHKISLRKSNGGSGNGGEKKEKEKETKEEERKEVGLEDGMMEEVGKKEEGGKRRGEGAHARAPEPARLDYVNRPKSKEGGSAKGQEGINRAKNLEKRMKSMMRRRNK